MQPADYTAILRKTGWVLVAVGLIDIAMMIYTISLGMSYSSSLNIFAVVAGLFLIGGKIEVRPQFTQPTSLLLKSNHDDLPEPSRCLHRSMHRDLNSASTRSGFL
jgi:hypothetical protein